MARAVHTQAATDSTTPTQTDTPSAVKQPPPAPQQVQYSPLHFNIEDFCDKVAPTELEHKAREQVIEMIRKSIRSTLPRASVEVFGSHANGLSTWKSDVDLVVTGTGVEIDPETGKYIRGDKARVSGSLRRIADSLKYHSDLDLTSLTLIPQARIPIIKLTTTSLVAADISVHDDSGPRAARFMSKQVRAYPAMKPLVLVLKAYLKSQKLNEVQSGGLSSYSLSNMVIAHLQEEIKDGHDVSDFGEVLYSFLIRYGEEFDYGRDAISVSSGGVVAKSLLGFDHGGWGFRGLCVDCPLTGRNVSSATHRIDDVADAFASAARKLEVLVQRRPMTDRSTDYLRALFDVDRILKRKQPQLQQMAPDTDWDTVLDRLLENGVDVKVSRKRPRAKAAAAAAAGTDADAGAGGDAGTSGSSKGKGKGKGKQPEERGSGQGQEAAQ